MLEGGRGEGRVGLEMRMKGKMRKRKGRGGRLNGGEGDGGHGGHEGEEFGAEQHDCS